MNRTEILPRVDGRDISDSYRLGRCPAEGWVRQENGGAGYDGNWARVRGCDLAFYYRVPGGRHGDVTCPGCGLALDVTTRRLRAGFLPLSPADVRNIRAHKGQPCEVSCLSPIVAAHVPTPLTPAEIRKVSLRERAEAALLAFDVKPRCTACWGYNASAKRHATCGFCREWGEDRVTAEGERDSYTYKREELVERVQRYNGTVGPAPVGQDAYEQHIAERRRKAAEYKAKRIAELRAQGVRGY